MPPKGLFVIIPGFGGPNVATKVDILSRNLATIQTYPWQFIKVRICVYDDTELPESITSLPFVEIVRERGIVAEFLIRHAKPDEIDPCYDMILMLLDDILLGTPIPWMKMFGWKHDLGLDILSPVLTKDSKYVYPYMLQNTETRPYHILRVVRVCEFFCYFIDRDAYRRFYMHFDANNPWMWGLDLIMDRHLKLKVGLMNTVLMKHFFHGDAYKLRPDAKPTDGYDYVLAKYGENGDQALRDQSHTKYIIFECS